MGLTDMLHSLCSGRHFYDYTPLFQAYYILVENLLLLHYIYSKMNQNFFILIVCSGSFIFLISVGTASACSWINTW